MTASGEAVTDPSDYADEIPEPKVEILSREQMIYYWPDIEAAHAAGMDAQAAKDLDRIAGLISEVAALKATIEALGEAASRALNYWCGDWDEEEWEHCDAEHPMRLLRAALALIPAAPDAGGEVKT